MNCKLEDQVEIIDLDEDDTTISRHDNLNENEMSPLKHKVSDKFVKKTFSSMSSKGNSRCLEVKREQSKQPKSSSLKILLSWVSCSRIIW